MPRNSLSVEEVLALLAATPERIAELTAGLSQAQLRTRPSPDEWSVNDVLAHLRACADVRGDCIPVILAEDRPTLRAVDPRKWMTKTDYPALEFRASFQAFTSQRAGLLAVLNGLTPKDWARAATVTGAGKPLEWTVLSYAAWVAVHERPHVKQIAAIVSSLRG